MNIWGGCLNDVALANNVLRAPRHVSRYIYIYIYIFIYICLYIYFDIHR